jgi:hypothetical protein
MDPSYIVSVWIVKIRKTDELTPSLSKGLTSVELIIRKCLIYFENFKNKRTFCGRHCYTDFIERYAEKRGFMKNTIILAALCSLLISCATMDNGAEQAPSPTPATDSAAGGAPSSPDLGISTPAANPVDIGDGSQAQAESQAAVTQEAQAQTMNEQRSTTEMEGVSPVPAADTFTAGSQNSQIPPLPEMASTLPEKHAAYHDDSSASTSRFSEEKPRAKKSVKKSQKKSKAIAKKSSKKDKIAKKSSKKSIAKNSSKKSKVAKKLSKADCKKIAKHTKKASKKEIAMCKAEKKKVAQHKSKKLGKVAQGDQPTRR